MKSGFKEFLLYLKLTYYIKKTTILSAMEFRGSFLMQVFGMFLNDVGLVVLWLIFFERFPTVNGWTLDDTKLLFAITTTNFAIMFILGAGAFEISRIIPRGELDYFLSFPKNVLWHLSVSRTEIPAIGDLLFGIVIYSLLGHPTPTRTLLFIFYTVLTAGIMYNFIVITQSFAFLFRNVEELTRDMFHAFLTFSFYPQSVFNGVLKVIMMTILPAFFAASIPVSVMREFSWPLTLLSIGFWLVTAILAVFLFHYGLRKYESGNLIGVKM